jgi:hypothetical protein
VIATQRLAKLAKNVAAEASNFLMGRTFLDIDMARAADLLGMERRQAEAIRDLERGTFLALGPAVARRPVAIRIGAVETSARSSSPKLTPLPQAPAEGIKDMLLAPAEPTWTPPAPSPAPKPLASETLIEALARSTSVAAEPESERDPEETAGLIADVLRDIVGDGESALRSPAVLYQDFLVRCRMVGLARPPLDLSNFVRRLSAARAGIHGDPDEDWSQALDAAGALPDDMLGPFLLVARAAREGLPCPSDTEIAASYGTSSLGRVRRLMTYIESRDLFVTRVDLSGKRSITIPRLGWTTQPAEVG